MNTSELVPTTFAERIVAYMELKGYILSRKPGELNIVYIEGCDETGAANADTWDEWNDRRTVITFMDGKPVMVYNAAATTEPGRAPTYTTAAKSRGGVFRIAFGQYNDCWVDGYHKGRPTHPALVQVPGAQVWGYGDLDQNGKRTGDQLRLGIGINQHGTAPGFLRMFVGGYSEGCLVAFRWAKHLEFVRLYRTDPRYVADRKFRFSSTVIPGDDLQRRYPIGVSGQTA